MFRRKKIPMIEVDSFQKEKKLSITPSEFRAGGVFYGKFEDKSEEARNLIRFGRKKWQEKYSSDDDILQSVCEKILDTRFVKNREIKISVTNGRVFLSGRIDNLECKKIIEEIIKSIKGVRDIVNDLLVEF